MFPIYKNLLLYRALLLLDNNMKLGYPCINRSLDCSSSRTFRLKSFSNERFLKTVENNLVCLKNIIEFNRDHDLLFFRISSDLIPFASHPICSIAWDQYFEQQFKEIGRLIKMNKMRISMHPDQCIVLNSSKEDVVRRSMLELLYHAKVLDLMGLDVSAKIQLHVGGKYGEKQKSINRFITTYERLPFTVKRRLVIENDERSYCIKDCLLLHKQIGIPVLFDVYHHQLYNHNELITDILQQVSDTWTATDGIPMVDYSSANRDKRFGSHTESIDKEDFVKFISDSRPYDFDIMLEIKDKEKSALLAKTLLQTDGLYIQ